MCSLVLIQNPKNDRYESGELVAQNGGSEDPKLLLELGYTVSNEIGSFLSKERLTAVRNEYSNCDISLVPANEVGVKVKLVAHSAEVIPLPESAKIVAAVRKKATGK